MKIKLYAMPLITISSFIQAMDEPPTKPVKALTRDGKSIKRAQIPTYLPNYNEQSKPATTIIKPKEPFETFIERLDTIRHNVIPSTQQQAKSAVEQDVAQLVKQDNYTGSNQKTLAYNIELIDYLKRNNEDSGMIIQDNIRELIPLLEKLNPNINSEQLQKNIWKNTSNLILFSRSLNEINLKQQKDLTDLKNKHIEAYVKSTLEGIEQEKIAKENSLFARLKRLPQRIYSNVSELLSPINSIQYSLLFRVILIPLAYIFSEKQ